MLEVRPEGTVMRDDPYLPPRATTDLPPPPGRVAAPRARSAAGPTVRKAINQAYEAGQITAEQRSEWRRAYTDALRTRADLSGARRIQLSSQIETLEAIARADGLDASRMPALFLQLARNTEYWPDGPYPVSGQRVSFAGSSLVFQYYSGQGLQIQPLANFGKANALWRDGRAERLRSLLDELVAIASRRGRFTTWEYWFRVRRRDAALDERHGAGHRDPGAGARRAAARRPLVPERRADAASAPSRRARPWACACAARTAATTT